MLFTKMASCPRIINFSTRNYIYRCIFATNKCEINYCPTRINSNWNLMFKILHTNILRYSTKPIEVPPLPPPPPPESEVFGRLGGLNYERIELDEGELRAEEKEKNTYIRIPRKFKPSLGQYADMIKNYIGKGDIKAAESVIELCILNKDKPSEYMYTLLIRALAMHGDVKQCFKYFADMKTRKHKIKSNTCTSLLNACANSPDSDKSIRYLERLRTYMETHKIELNHVHYNVLVKAYGRHNKLEEANKLIEQMLSKNMKLGISTYNSLMYAANFNAQSGLKHFLYYWQMMRKSEIPPNIFTYNLLLRAIRDTNFGNCKINELLLPHGKSENFIIDKNRPDLLVYPPVISTLPFDNIQRKDSNNINGLLSAPIIESSSASSNIPQSSAASSDIPESTATLSNKPAEEWSQTLPEPIANLNLDAILKQNKLILFGGVEGLLEKMKNDKVEPNVKTLTFLIELVPDSLVAEDMIVKYAKSNNIPLDIDFFNILIKKRSLRGAKTEAKDVLDEIHKTDLKPNIVTYGVLALCCTTTKESKALLQTMRTTHHTINKYVAESLLHNAFFRIDFPFILELMELMKFEKIRLDEQTFEKLDEFRLKMKKMIKTKHPKSLKENFQIGFAKFNMRYKTWQVEMERNLVTERVEKSQ